jgi:hypothetical protein
MLLYLVAGDSDSEGWHLGAVGGLKVESYIVVEVIFQFVAVSYAASRTLRSQGDSVGATKAQRHVTTRKKPLFGFSHGLDLYHSQLSVQGTGNQCLHILHRKLDRIREGDGSNADSM